jgi:hypothetical protein
MLVALQSVAVPGFLEPSVEDVGHVSRKQAASAMADALAACCRLRPAVGNVAA